MSLKALTVGEQVTLSEVWVSSTTAQYKALMEVPELAVLMPRLEQAHRALVGTQTSPSTPTLGQLTERIQRLDERHDDLVRAIVHVVRAFAIAAPTNDEADKLFHLSEQLFPDGISIIRRSYRDEAGETKLLGERLTGETLALVKTLPLPGGRTVFDLIQELLEVGKEMGELEDQRAAEKSSANTVSATDVIRVRNEWVRGVTALMTLAEMVEISDDKYQLLFGPLKTAVASSVQRRKQRKAAKKSTEPKPATPTPSET